MPGHDWIPIVKLVDYKTIVARPNAAFLNKRRQLTTGGTSPSSTLETGISVSVY